MTEGRVLFTAQRRVLMDDTDAAGVIYYGSVFRWHEHVVTGWLASLQHPVRSILREGYAFPCVHAEADYHHALRVDDHLEVRLHPGHVGTTSFQLTAVAWLGHVRALTVRAAYVWARTSDLDVAGFASAHLPDWLRAALEQ